VKTIEVEVINRLGLHARPAAKLTQKANEFLSEIKIDKDGRVVNGKSIMGVMLLAASKGTVLKISADGTDEESALQQLKEGKDLDEEKKPSIEQPVYFTQRAYPLLEMFELSLKDDTPVVWGV
jgi:phosphotransferase system HPr (HPr) family protein